MGFIYDTILELDEQLLDEDKMVKYDGEISPKFGWCVILLGGPGSGKGYSRNHYMNIDAKVVDVDELKNPTTMKKLGLWSAIEKQFPNEEDRDVDNDTFTSAAHNLTKPYASKAKKQALDMGKHAHPDRLPNILFDITGDSLRKINKIIAEVKPLGYKVALVAVLSEIEDAVTNNFSRKRTVKRDIFIEKHEKVLLTLSEIFNTDLDKRVDEMWLIDASARNNRESVYDIKDGLDKFEFIIDRIKRNSDWLQNPISSDEWESRKEKIKAQKSLV